MVTDPVVVIDVNYCAYRSFYSTGGLTHGGDATGVVYGVMRFVRDLEARWPLAKMVFCFDHGKNVREEVFPDYKITRRKKREEEMSDPAKKKLLLGLKKQVQMLKEDLLHRAGYKNVFYQEGYEADDIMAQVVKQIRRTARADNKPVPDTYLVTGDHDLYQWVSGRVAVWHPKENKVVRAEDLANEFGVLPAEWKKVKCIAGCSSDDIPGVPGIGEKKAAAFVRWASEGDGRKPCPGVGADALNTIMEFTCSPEYVRNHLLVALPLKGTEEVKFRRDAVSPDGWNRVMYDIGAQSLVKGEKARPKGEVRF